MSKTDSMSAITGKVPRAVMKVTVLALALALVFVALTGLGRLVVVEDPLQRSDVIVVFGGGLPYRAIEAAGIYKAGWAPEIWVTYTDSNEERALRQLGIGYVGEDGYTARVLEKLGVPANAIQKVGPVVNTTDEVQLIAKNLRAKRGTRVILVSSKSHTRRIRVTWQALVEKDLHATIRFASGDPYRPERWYLNSRDVLAVTREVGGILNLWAGSPLAAARD